MQNMHSKLNDMNEVGEQIGTQLNNSPQLSSSINTKMDVLESKWNSLLEQMEYLSRACTELQQIEIIKAKIAAASSVQSVVTTSTKPATGVAESHDVSTDAVMVGASGGGEQSDGDGEAIKKRRMQLSDEDRRNFETTVNQLNKALDNVKSILTTDNPNKDEQFDLIRVRYSREFLLYRKILFADAEISP